MVAKMSSLATLLIAGGWIVFVVWLVLEIVLLMVVKVVIGNWWYYRRGLDTQFVRCLTHLVHYMGLLACPFPLFRNPVFLSPRLYSAGLLYMLLINFAQVGVAYRYFGGNDTVTETTAWSLLVADTVVCVVAGALAYRYVPTPLKKSFYEHRTMGRHMETFRWNEARYGTDHKGRELNTQEGIRACMPLRYSDHYLPKDKLKAFFEENWRRWEEEESEWFDDEFKELVPTWLLPSWVLSTSALPSSVPTYNK